MDICLLQVPPTPATRTIRQRRAGAACLHPARQPCLAPTATA